MAGSTAFLSSRATDVARGAGMERPGLGPVRAEALLPIIAGVKPLAVDATPRPDGAGRRHVQLALRLLAGWLLATAAIAMAVSTVETWEPVVDCGGPALRIVVDGSAGGAPPGRAGDCAESAADQLSGGLGLFGIPALLLLAWPRAARRWRQVQQIETVASRESGVWRMSVAARRLGVLGMGSVLAVLALVLLLGDVGTFVLTAAFGLPFVAYLDRIALHPRLVVEPTGLRIVNPFRSSFVPWTEIRRVAPGYGGLEIHLHDGGLTFAWVGQKTNWATWRSRRRYADDIADAAAGVAATAQGRPPSALVATHDEQRSAARGAMLVGGACVIVMAAVRVAFGW